MDQASVFIESSHTRDVSESVSAFASSSEAQPRVSSAKASPQPAASRVLAHAVADGSPVELVEYADHSVSILIAGAALRGYRWPKHEIEACVKTYLRLLRRHQEPAS